MADVSHLLNMEPRTDLDQARPGDSVRIHWQVTEGTRIRTQVFQGFVLRLRNGGNNASVTVRRVFQGIGVERTFLLHHSKLQRIEIVRRASVRRAKLYYLRGRTGKAARIKEKTTPRPVRASRPSR